MEGEQAAQPRAIDLARQDVITCRLDEMVGAVSERVAASPYSYAFVTSADGVLLGRLRNTALAREPQLPAGEVMEPGPSTTRPDLSPAKVLDKLRSAQLTTAVLSDPEGRLIGIVTRQDLETAPGESER